MPVKVMPAEHSKAGSVLPVWYLTLLLVQVVNEDIQSSSFGSFLLLAVVVFLMVNRELSLQLLACVLGLVQVTLQ